MMKRVVIESRGGHDGAATGGHYGSWAEVIVSRPEIVNNVEVAKEEHERHPGRLTSHQDYIEVSVSWDPELLGDEDYILIHHRRSPNPYLRGSSSRESYELIAGKMPAWADFPARWQEWVRSVRESARDHLLNVARWSGDAELERLVLYALRKSSKGRISAAWEAVQQHLEELGMLRYRPKHRYTWTGVRAMPIRIAQALVAHYRWEPPIQKPRYDERHGGVVVASPRIEGYVYGGMK